MNCMKMRIRDKKGFTLTEIVIAALIGGILLVSLLTSFVMGRFSISLARHKTQAMNLLRARVESLKSMEYTAVNSMTSPTVEDNLVLDSNPGHTSNIYCKRTTSISDDDGDEVLEIKVQLEWTERSFGGTNTVKEELFTFLAPG